MRHASLETLDALEPLLEAVRRRLGLEERRRGVFYRRGRAVLHFHDDRARVFADLKCETEWRRIDVTDEAGRAALLRLLDP